VYQARVEPNEGVGVGNSVESHRMNPESAIQLRLLGPLAVSRDGKAVVLPGSRKVRALMAYLAVAPHALTRSQLCELLWDVPNDPRGQLRWCLSKLRSVLDEPGRRRVTTSGDSVRLDVGDVFVDTIEIERAAQAGVATLSLDRLQALAALFQGEFLEGLEIDRNPAFYGWLTAQRRRLRGIHAALLEHLVNSTPDEAVFGYLDKWLALAPFDPRVHEILLNALARRGRIREGEDHLAATARLFDTEGFDHTEIQRAWKTARAHAESPTRVQTTTAARLMEPDAGTPAGARRASIAVMPFVDRSEGGGSGGGSADGLVHDVITRLAKLRSLFVIAQGTVFALQERGIGSDEAGRILNVDYVVSGSLQRRDKRLSVSVELSETRTARIVWAEVFDHRLDDAFLVLDEIGNRIVASIANEIETIERNRAILKPPNSLDAWEAHHRGISSKPPCGSIQLSRAPMPAFRSRIGRTPSRAGRSARRRPSAPTPPPGKA
jgi:DNA-binding SARP family transcriptional activator